MELKEKDGISAEHQQLTEFNVEEKVAIKQEVSAPRKYHPAYLLYCNAILIVGSTFVYGYNVTVINGPYFVMSQYQNESMHREGFNMSTKQLRTQWSLTVALYLIGGLVGSTWIPGALSAKIGRMRTLAVACIFAIAGEILIFVGPMTGSFMPVMVGRFVAGIQAGIAMVITPAVIKEMAPIHLKGMCGVVYSIGTPAGSGAASLFSVSFLLATPDQWHYLFLLIGGIMALYCIGLSFVHVQGEGSCLKSGCCSDTGDRSNKLTQNRERGIRLGDIFQDRSLWWPLFIIINTHISGRWTGIVALFSYTTLLLTGAGLSADGATLSCMGMMVATIVTTVISGFITDRIGRRRIMIYTLAGIALNHGFIIFFLKIESFIGSIISLTVFIIFFSFGPGPMPFMLQVELMPPAARLLGSQVGIFVNMACVLSASFIFPILQFYIGPFSFLPFAVVSVAEFFFCLLFLPETSGKLAPGYNPQVAFAPGKSLLQLGKRNS